MRGCVSAQVEDFGRIVTVGELGSGEFHVGVYGYGSGIGALNETFWRGHEILLCRTGSVGDSPQLFNFMITGVVTKDYFTSLQLQKTDGSFVTLLTADVPALDFSTSGGNSRWTWGETSPPVSTWSIPDIGQKRVVRIR